MAAAASSPGVLSGLLRELRSWARCLLPGSRYVAPFYATPRDVARRMLRLAAVGPADTVVDLGCGDGRVVILAVQEFGAKAALGVELDASLAAEAAATVAAQGLQGRVSIVCRDASGLDVRAATVLSLYLSTSGNRALLDSLVGLRPGTRVVSLFFPVRGWDGQLQQVDRGANIDKFLYVVQQGQQQQQGSREAGAGRTAEASA